MGAACGLRRGRSAHPPFSRARARSRRRWPEQLRQHREQYARDLDKHSSHPGSSEGDLALNNPLSTSAQSPWSQFFAGELPVSQRRRRTHVRWRSLPSNAVFTQHAYAHTHPSSSSRLLARACADSELLSEIKRDLTRTHPESDFFQRDDVQKIMLNVLFLWGKMNPAYGYRQGPAPHSETDSAASSRWRTGR